MSQILRGKRASDIVEFMYATTALFLLTQGPVYTLWKPSADYLQFLPDPPVSVAYFATFALAQLPGVLLLARRLPIDLFRLLPFRLLAALLMWLGITSALSTFARHSVPEFLALVLTTCFGLYLAVTFSVRTVLWQLVIAMGTGSWLSYLAVVRLWEGARDIDEGYWIGIYFNRNSLAPVAAVGMLSTALLIINRRLRAHTDLLGSMFSSVVFVFSGMMLYQSESATSVIALVITGVVVAVWLGVSRLTNVNVDPAQSGRVLAATVVAAALVVGTALTYVAKSASVFGRVETFSARAPIWSMNWSGFLERPLLGWGWQAAWNVPQFLKQGVWWAVPFENNWAHSGYFDLLLGGGVAAGLLFAGWVVVSCLHTTPSESHSPTNNHNQRAPVAFSIFVLAAATQESFFIGSHFLWGLLVWGLTSAVLGSRVSSRAESQPTSAANVAPAASPR
jgi:exopolysaccharide production protein ExoQ